MFGEAADPRASMNMGNRTAIPRPRGKSEAFGMLKPPSKPTNFLMPPTDNATKKGVRASTDLNKSSSRNPETVAATTEDSSKLNITRDLETDNSSRTVQLKQIIQQQTNECIQLLGEKVFYDTIGFFRNKLNVQIPDNI